MNNVNKKKIATMALAGLAAGAAVWFLFKSQKGREISSNLMGSIRDKVNDKIDQFSGQAGIIVNGLKSKARDSIKMPV